MFPLPVELRKALENVIPNARTVAEEAAAVVLTTLAVERAEPFASMSPEQRRLRNALRARARQLGNGVMNDGLGLLREEIAYEQWHRMVFACFLAENNLLMHPTGVAVTLKDCEDLAADENEVDGWAVAAKYASAMLPGIFRADDPSAQVRFAPEGLRALETILRRLPALAFTADDALGWMYQFWQSNKKKEVNDSERKIGGADISPVTQLFTEDYMVRFLLENSLGAWWAGMHPNSPLLKRWDYLRFKDDGTPAAGTFAGWQRTAAEITLMDPCCGSGHILVAGFEMLCLMRMEEEGLDEAAAAEAVLSDNIFGLELDPRCTQIAAFALALSAWKRGGYRDVPVPNVACSGIPVQGQLDSWLKLAGKDARLRAALERLYNLFSNAPDLGSLINPADLQAADRMFVADYEQVAPLLKQVLAKERNAVDPSIEIFGTAAEGVLKATEFLVRKYTLVATNVPYLGYKKQNDVIRKFCKENYDLSKADLATAFIERCRTFCQQNGTYSLVTPQNWFFLGSYKGLREELLVNQEWNNACWLGAGAFETISGEIVKPVLVTITNSKPTQNSCTSTIDVEDLNSVNEKANGLIQSALGFVNQQDQYNNPDYRITSYTSKSEMHLSDYADSAAGLLTGDSERFYKNFWEIQNLSPNWEFLQTTVDETSPFGGRNQVILWEGGLGQLYKLAQSLKHLNNVVQNWRRGQDYWGKHGVAVSQMGNLPVSLYQGDRFDCNTAAIIPKDKKNLKALWCYCSSPEFALNVRRIDKSLKVTNRSLLKVPFDLEHWQKVAEAAGPLPEPHSNDPTQWLFKGHPKGSTNPLQVAVARLLGYRWHDQPHDNLDALADEDGIVAVSALVHERPAAERLREILSAAYNSPLLPGAPFGDDKGSGVRSEWSPRLQSELLAQAGAEGKSLEEWLRDDFFPQHCRLFHNRPFLWHIWDGRKDGFSALVNYHKLDAARLDKLIFTYLGDWIRFQRARRDQGESGADARLVAALELEKKLKLIKAGEPPYDIYVRWKALKDQPLGWNPDLNDGVRLNIRPFVEAGILRSKFTINWKKDRGKNPDGTDRENDIHLTNAEKLSARGRG